MSNVKKFKRRLKLPGWVPLALFFAGPIVAGMIYYYATKTDALTKPLHVRPNVEQLRHGDFEEANEGSPGQKADLTKFLVHNKYTIIDFSSVHCPACMKIRPYLVELTTVRSDIAVRGLDTDRPGSEFIDWGSPLMRQYHIHSLPEFKIYGPRGQLLIEGDRAHQQVVNTLNAELMH